MPTNPVTESTKHGRREAIADGEQQKHQPDGAGRQRKLRGRGTVTVRQRKQWGRGAVTVRQRKLRGRGTVTHGRITSPMERGDRENCRGEGLLHTAETPARWSEETEKTAGERDCYTRQKHQPDGAGRQRKLQGRGGLLHTAETPARWSGETEKTAGERGTVTHSRNTSPMERGDRENCGREGLLHTAETPARWSEETEKTAGERDCYTRQKHQPDGAGRQRKLQGRGGLLHTAETPARWSGETEKTAGERGTVTHGRNTSPMERGDRENCGGEGDCYTRQKHQPDGVGGHRKLRGERDGYSKTEKNCKITR